MRKANIEPNFSVVKSMIFISSWKNAIKYDPPILGFIFEHKKNQKRYLLEVNIQEQIEQNELPINICNWIYATYGDVVNITTYPQAQIIRMINKMINKN